MERNYFNKEFEQFVKQNADQYRMIPSEKVWKGINHALHTRRKWYGIGFSILLLSTAISVTWVMLSNPGTSKQEAIASSTSSSITRKLPTVPVNPVQPVSAVSSTADLNKLLSIKSFDMPEASLAPARSPLAISESQVRIADEQLDNPGFAINPGTQMAPTLSPLVIVAVPDKKSESPVKQSVLNPLNKSDKFSLLTADEKLLVNDAAPKSNVVNKSAQDIAYVPFTIESVINSYKPIKLPKRLAWQIYVAPTVSYRRLTANKSFKNSGPFADPIVYPFVSLTDVNKAVTHKPDMGLELGFATGYPLMKNLRVKAGMQFNINRYDIKAYVYKREQAMINLNGNDNSVTAWTYYRNYNGYKTDWLKNFYFSVSAPIGVEWTAFGNKRTSFGVAGTVQPTYILRDRAYLISTDYKNYAEVPWLVRRVNANTSLETFVNFTSRTGTRWQIGPQVRYQVFSSYHENYPVRENLFDFGLKMGVTLNQ